VIVSEIGTDMSVFPSAGHLAYWAGLCPCNDTSAGKRRSGRTRKGSRWLGIALTEAAQANTGAEPPVDDDRSYRAGGRSAVVLLSSPA
jgi:transposase